MSLKNLDNLVKTGDLKPEPPNQHEFDGLIASAKTHLQDSKLTGLSKDGQFFHSYEAAHSLSLAAMRWHGYRSDRRNLVFQCLEHTLGLERVKWRVLGECHHQRNLAAYEGHLEISPQLLKELIEITEELLQRVESLGTIPAKNQL